MEIINKIKINNNEFAKIFINNKELFEKLNILISNNNLNLDSLLFFKNNVPIFCDLEKDTLNIINYKIYNICSHTWILDTSNINERSEMICSICKLNKN
jgi:hypothetical protein